MGTIVTLLSDFGMRDSYVAEMKASILSICPEVTLVDISHEIRKFDIQMGAFVLASAARSFPEGTVHLAVVDPGVGSERRPIIVKSRRAHFVGPDNGILMLAAVNDRLESVYHIATKSFLRVSHPTFHGRDIFAPIAGLLAKGVNASELGVIVSDYSKPSSAEPKRMGNRLSSRVIHIDDFGDIVTGIRSADIEKRPGEFMRIRMGRRKTLRLRLVRTYSDLEDGSLGCLIGSHGFLEIAENKGSASKRLNVRRGESLSILFEK